jgi:hypothetical protein
MSVTLYEPGLFALLDAPISPVGRYVTVKAEMVAEQARENVRANFRSRTGTLEQSIGAGINGACDRGRRRVGLEVPSGEP